jgi:hypothetical protein
MERPLRQRDAKERLPAAIRWSTRDAGLDMKAAGTALVTVATKLRRLTPVRLEISMAPVDHGLGVRLGARVKLGLEGVSRKPDLG